VVAEGSCGVVQSSAEAENPGVAAGWTTTLSLWSLADFFIHFGSFIMEVCTDTHKYRRSLKSSMGSITQFIVQLKGNTRIPIRV
jgi:hypothetical protein